MGRGEHVMVVEDDADVRAVAVSFLGNLGYNVKEAGSAEAARARLAGRAVSNTAHGILPVQ